MTEKTKTEKTKKGIETETNQVVNPTTSEYTKVINSKIHGKGIFAAKEILKGTKIIEYVGEIITKKESAKRATLQLERHNENSEEGSVYIFTLDKQYDIDGNVDYNTAKYINHSCSPNCTTDEIDKEIWIIAKKNISKGEELTYNYGYNLDEYEKHPCRCGAKNCVGYIVAEEDRKKLKKKIKKKKMKLKRLKS